MQQRFKIGSYSLLIAALSVCTRFQGIDWLFIFRPADIGVAGVSWLGMKKLMKKIVHRGV